MNTDTLFNEKKMKLKWNSFNLVHKDFIKEIIYPFIKAFQEAIPNRTINKIIVVANQKSIRDITTAEDDFSCTMPNNIDLEFKCDCQAKNIRLIPMFGRKNDE